MELLGSLVSGVVLYWCIIGEVSAGQQNAQGQGITDITTVTISTTATQILLHDNLIGTNGIPQTYFSVSMKDVF